MTTQSVQRHQSQARQRLMSNHQSRRQLHQSHPILATYPRRDVGRGTATNSVLAIKEIPRRLFLVEVEKSAPDKSAPRRTHIFYRWLYRPFQRFALKYFLIPSGAVMEHIGIYANYEEADAACKTEFYVITPFTEGETFPEESVQVVGQVRPRAGKPDRYLVPTFPLTAVRRNKLFDLRIVDERLSELAESIKGKSARVI